MKYKAYKFSFPTSVHFGNGSINESMHTFHADTLFSALCQEALKLSDETLNQLVSDVQSGKILLTDAMPFSGDTYFLPKPLMKIEHSKEEGDSKLKKAFKNLKFIPEDCLDMFTKGELSATALNGLDMFGCEDEKVSVSIRGESEPKPYRIGTFSFNQKNGLYIIVGYEQETDVVLVEKLLNNLSYDGIGGRRHSGMGRFSLLSGEIPDDLKKRFEPDYSVFMTLSVSLPQEYELDDSVRDSSFLVTKRSGFVSSENYAEEFRRKKDLYVFASGSCFHHRFNGNIYDVSSGGTHPVYRYAKPFFVGVKR